MSFKRDAFEKTGGFRTNVGRFGKNLLAGEEPEFSLRLVRTIPEARIVYDPSATVYHKVPKGRAKVRYLLRRSFYEGLSKAIIRNGDRNSRYALSVEQAYTKFVFNVVFPSRLRRFYRFKNLCHLSVISASMALVVLGFLVGRFRKA